MQPDNTEASPRPANSWYSPPGSAGEKVAYGYDTLSDHAEKHGRSTMLRSMLGF